MLKKLVWMMLLCLLLTGCGSDTFETMGPVAHVSQTTPPVREILLDLPADATVLSASGMDSIYNCGDFDLLLQVQPAGDIQFTVQQLCGYDPRQLTVIESSDGSFARYDWSWTAAGENGDVICRAAVLDDGAYHYSLCVSAEASLVGNLTEQWNELFSSLDLGGYTA